MSFSGDLTDDLVPQEITEEINTFIADDVEKDGLSGDSTESLVSSDIAEDITDIGVVIEKDVVITIPSDEPKSDNYDVKQATSVIEEMLKARVSVRDSENCGDGGI